MIENNQVKIYIAGPWVRREECKGYQKQLEDAGFTIVSRWITKHIDLGVAAADLNTPDEKVQEELTKQAIEDVLDLETADVFLIINSEKSEGKAFEFGYACAMRLPIIAVGDRSNNIFYQLPHVVVTPTLEEAIDVLNAAIEKQNSFDLANEPKLIVEA